MTRPQYDFDRWEAEQPPAAAPIEFYADHEILDIEDLPRGPKMVARKVKLPWESHWRYSRSSEAECYAAVFRHLDGRLIWAAWVDGDFEGAFLYLTLVSKVPRRLKSKEMKEILADG